MNIDKDRLYGCNWLKFANGDHCNQAHREGGVTETNAPGPWVLRGPGGPPQKISAGVKRGESEQAEMGGG